MIRHPHVARPADPHDQPHAARVALAFFGQRLCEHAEVAVDVGFASRADRARAARRRSGCSPCIGRGDARRVQPRAPHAACHVSPRRQRSVVSHGRATDCLACPNYGARLRARRPSHGRHTPPPKVADRAPSNGACSSPALARSPAAALCPIVRAMTRTRCCEGVRTPLNISHSSRASRARWRSPATRSALRRRRSPRARRPPRSRPRRRRRK